MSLSEVKAHRIAPEPEELNCISLSDVVDRKMNTEVDGSLGLRGSFLALPFSSH